MRSSTRTRESIANTSLATAAVASHKPISSRAAELLARYTPLVKQIAGGFQRMLPRTVLREDLVAGGMVGLWDAICRNSERSDESFEWYVRIRIRGAILDELRAQDWLSRRMRAAVSEDGRSCAPRVVRFDDISAWEQARCLGSSDAIGSYAELEAKSEREHLARAVDHLPERERHIVASHYFRGVLLKTLGSELGVSEPRISQLHSRAMLRLKAIMAA